MKSWIGLDPSPAAVRWNAIQAEDERTTGDVAFRLRGCPRTGDYLSGDNWSDPLALKSHCFETFEDGVDKTGDYRFIEPNSTDWMRGYFAEGSKTRPPIDPQSVLTLAIPNATNSQIQDAYLANLPVGYRKTYLLWRPIAIVLSWLNRMSDEVRDGYEGRRVFVLDFDGGYPELSEIVLKRHRRMSEWIVPSRRPPRQVEELQDGTFDDAILAAAFGERKEYRQLMTGLCASRMQELLESREVRGDVWIRRDGAWSHPTIDIPTKIDGAILKPLNNLFRGVGHIEADDVLLLNGWAARRFQRQFVTVFEKFGCELEVVAADAVADGASLFSQRIDLGLPTYYDIVPDYRLFDSIAMRWMPLFANGEDEDVEPGARLQARTFDNLVMKKFSDEVSIYVQNANEKTSRRYARKLKVMLSRLAREDVPLSLTASVQVACGSARLKFSMRDERQDPIFIVDKKPSRALEFRYSVERGAQVSGVWEPAHRGYPEPQPVLGRIYDSAENVQMAEDWLEAWKRGVGDLSRVPSFVAYKRRYHATMAEPLLLVRCGYSAGDSEPTRGLLGTKRLPNMPQIDELAARLASVRPAGADYWKWQNWCHSFAADDYKKEIRERLAAANVHLTYNHAYAPGYVLGDEPGDLALLLTCILNSCLSGKVVPMLWWSVFRMLCWHPECRVADLELAEAALWKLVREDVHTSVNPNDQKFFALAVLYLLRVREPVAGAVPGQMPRDYSPELLQALKGLFVRGGALAATPTPKTMMGDYQPDGTLADYVVRFIDRKETIRDRELGARLGGE
jgi:hypothetical protein